MATIANVAVIGVTLFTAVLIVHLGLVVHVAVETVEDRTISRVDVAGGTTTPLTIMLAAEDREELGVVIDKLTSRPGRMAVVASGARVAVAVHTAMDAVSGRIGVTVQTVKQRTVIRRRMAFVTVDPLPMMHP